MKIKLTIEFDTVKYGQVWYAREKKYIHELTLEQQREFFTDMQAFPTSKFASVTELINIEHDK